ncbi:hypothetical protein CPB97_006467 [Podila verticillata]|nr:hypothetical protein CPB97_006467 [Podila verticillata]
MTSVGTSAAVVNMHDDFRESIPESEEPVLDHLSVSPIAACGSSFFTTTCEGIFVENSGTLGAEGMVKAGLDMTDDHEVRDVRGDDVEDEVRETADSLDSDVDVDVDVLDATGVEFDVVMVVVVSDKDDDGKFGTGRTIPQSFTWGRNQSCGRFSCRLSSSIWRTFSGM